MEHNLKGLVVDSNNLRLQKKFIDKVHEKGLKIMTYGLDNNNVEWLVEQSNFGIHGMIIDDVAEVLPKLISKLTTAIKY